MVDVAHLHRFQRGSAGAASIDEVVREVLAELGEPGSEAVRAADRAGIDPAPFAGARIEVAEGGQGAEPILTTIVVSIAAAAGSKIVESFWTEVLLPRIRRRLGADVLGPRLPDTRPSAPPASDLHPSEKDS